MPNGDSSDLMPREREVLELLTDFHTDQEIADTLVLSVRTVESHVAHMLQRRGARNRREAARMWKAKNSSQYECGYVNFDLNLSPDFGRSL